MTLLSYEFSLLKLRHLFEASHPQFEDNHERYMVIYSSPILHSYTSVAATLPLSCPSSFTFPSREYQPPTRSLSFHKKIPTNLPAYFSNTPVIWGIILYGGSVSGCFKSDLVHFPTPFKNFSVSLVIEQPPKKWGQKMLRKAIHTLVSSVHPHLLALTLILRDQAPLFRNYMFKEGPNTTNLQLLIQILDHHFRLIYTT